MKKLKCLLVVPTLLFLCGCLIQYASAQSELDPSSSYCFRFTWLGPQFDNTTTPFNATCTEYLDSIRAVGVPCRQPFVITNHEPMETPNVSYYCKEGFFMSKKYNCVDEDNASQPDIDYIWEHYPTQTTCRRARGSVCAKFSYLFNNVVQNTTYMCTQAYTVGEGATTGGCFTQTIDGYQVEVCLCESAAGYMPCNGSKSLKMSIVLVTIIGIVKFLFDIVNIY